MSVPDTLLPSPPTTESRHQKLFFGVQKPTINTPDESPASFLPSSGDASRKKVEFSPWTTNISETLNLTPDTGSSALLKDIPPSRDCQPTTRPILKSGTSTEILQRVDEQQAEVCVTARMESLLQQLSHNDRSSSIDAYQTMTALIKVYDEPPQEAMLKAKMSSLQRHIRRDLVILDDNTETISNEEKLMSQNLVMSALKVLVTMVWSNSFSPYLTDEFRAWTVERSIQVLKEHTLPKASLLHYIHLLATQNYRTSIMSTNNRAARLLEVLQELTKHVTGKAVLSERLLVYQKLIDQAKPLMKSKASMWIKDVVTAMTHSFKEVRNNAISVATRVYMAFPGSPSIAHALRTLLSQPTTLSQSAGDRILSVSLTNRLERIIATKDDAVQVPQVWALVLLMCHSTEAPIDSWPELMDWLRLIQRCFNCSDLAVRLQGFLAWNRFIYIARPYEASSRMVSMLAKPVVAQLDRTGNSISGKGSRPAAVSSYCNLLYYAFRPTSTHKQITRVWNEYIVKTMTSDFLSKSASNCDLSCRVLMSLFWNSNPGTKVWNENRAHENGHVDPQEIPTIDCKWIRSKANSILDLFQILVQYSSFGPDNYESDQAFVAQAWKHFLRAVRESSSKEIKQSLETKAALKDILQFLQQCQIDDAVATKTATEKHTSTRSRAKLLCNIALLELGPTAILEALEASPLSWNVCILEELLSTTTDSQGSGIKQQRPVANSSSTKQLLFERSTALLNAILLQSYADVVPSSINVVLELLTVVETIMGAVHKNGILVCMQVLQPGLSTIIKDDKYVFTDSANLPAAVIRHDRLCNTVIARLAELDLDTFIALDDILGALLSSTRTSVTNRLLEVWNKTIWQEDVMVYGPKMLKALEEVQTQTSVNLPGVTNIVQSDSNCLGAFEQIAETDIGSGHAEAAPEEAQKQTSLKLHNRTISQATDTSETNQSPTTLRKQTSRTSTPARRTRHDDSQMGFVPVESSPPEIDGESQLMTERQREVRDKQRSETAVTFADIRSSPKTQERSARTVDCGLSRKAASQSHSPATPTLPPGVPGNDFNEPPTPTPKSRQSRSRTPLPEIATSPSSVQDAAERPIGEITSSPIRDRIENVDTIQLDEEHRFSISEDNLSTSKAARYCVIEMDGTDQSLLEAVAEEQAPTTEEDITGENAQQNMSQHGQSLEERPLKNFQSENLNEWSTSSGASDGDEADAMAAFQLSQDHEHYSQSAFVGDSTSPPTCMPLPQKRRHTMDNQADDGSRAKKRKARSQSQDDSANPGVGGETVVLSLEPDPIPKCSRSRSPQHVASKHNEVQSTETDLDPAMSIVPYALHEAVNLTSSSPKQRVIAEEIMDVTEQESLVTTPKTDLAAQLQKILDSMEGQQEMITDIATIHSLCFKIGLKAQTLIEHQTSG